MRKKVIFIGNSIVAGYPWSKGKSFVGVVRRALKGDGEGDGLAVPSFAADTGFDIVNKGVNGNTTADIAARFEQDAIAHDPDIIFYLTGTNDFIYRDAGPREAFDNLQSLAARADSIGAISVFITPVPVDAGKAEYMWLAGCGISYDAVNRDLRTFSDLIRESGRPYIDINSKYHDFVSEVGDVDLAFMDGLHPMPDGHVFIAKQVLTFMEENADELGF